MMSAENARRYKRFKTTYLLKFHLAAEPASEHIYNITDLSASGLRFWSNKFFPEGSLLQMSFVMPPLNRTFEALSRIIRTRKYQGEDPKETPIYYIAVGFLDMPAKDQAQINDFIERIAQDRGARDLVDGTKKIKRRADSEKEESSVSHD